MKKVVSILSKLFVFFLMFISLLIIFSIKWALNNFDNLSIDEIIFHILGPLEGTESGKIIGFIKYSLFPSFVIAIAFWIILYFLLKMLKNKKYIVNVRLWKKKFNFLLSGNIINIFIKCITPLFLLIGIYISLNTVHFWEYLKEQNTNSLFIEENYVDPREVKLTFPKEKRNLIYLFVESLESSYFSTKLGGTMKNNLLKELTNLTKDNISFSNTEKFGGARSLVGTTWTSAAMVAQTTGLPTKLAAELTNDYSFNTYLPGAYSIGNILENAGYNQMLMLGSNAIFGNRRIFFETHGNYQIYDLGVAINNGKLPEGYYVWWGFEDSKLFEYAKEEIIKLASEDKPFNFTFLTANTHANEGYLEEICETPYENQYDNVISCTSKQIMEFVDWFKKQNFYENTTLVIVGDHLSMNPDYFKDENYERTVYNLFINSAVNTNDIYNRQFSTLDLFPTTLASLGVEIEGNKLALGTNLFSGEDTLIEKYGYEKVNEEFKLKSTFYNNKFIYNLKSD